MLPFLLIKGKITESIIISLSARQICSFLQEGNTEPECSRFPFSQGFPSWLWLSDHGFNWNTLELQSMGMKHVQLRICDWFYFWIIHIWFWLCQFGISLCHKSHVDSCILRQEMAIIIIFWAWHLACHGPEKLILAISSLNQQVVQWVTKLWTWGFCRVAHAP